ncbi:hypothetical protein BTUL_0019g00110 [Botrytis tulipae]|uniref:Uncharacterized protein n=1 Tax=Botrytis tulipae TaxID=87230 RepID=A0A4Z1F2H4_9HELO|nr:hypothetical protein BTUL_0019g00110 [Botrytis tulipae]
MYHPAGEQTLCRRKFVHAIGDEDEDMNQGYISAEKTPGGSRWLGNWVIDESNNKQHPILRMAMKKDGEVYLYHGPMRNQLECHPQHGSYRSGPKNSIDRLEISQSRKQKFPSRVLTSSVPFTTHVNLGKSRVDRYR